MQKSLGRKKKLIFSESDLDSDDSEEESDEDSDDDSSDDETDEAESEDDSSTDEGQNGSVAKYSADFQLEANLKGALKGGNSSTDRSEYRVYVRLDKLQKRRARGWTSAHWVECVMWVLPNKKTILLKQTEFAGATDGPKWTCKIDEQGRGVPSVTALAQHTKKQPKFAVSITGLHVIYMEASYGEEREIVVAFRRHTDLTDFNRSVEGFLVRFTDTGEVLKEDAGFAKSISQKLTRSGSTNLGPTKRNFSRKLLSLALRPRGNDGGEGLADRSDKQILKMVNSAIMEDEEDDDEDDLGDVQLFCGLCVESYNTTELSKKKIDGKKRFQCPDGHLLDA